MTEILLPDAVLPIVVYAEVILQCAPFRLPPPTSHGPNRGLRVGKHVLYRIDDVPAACYQRILTAVNMFLDKWISPVQTLIVLPNTYKGGRGKTTHVQQASMKRDGKRRASLPLRQTADRWCWSAVGCGARTVAATLVWRSSASFICQYCSANTEKSTYNIFCVERSGRMQARRGTDRPKPKFRQT